MTPEKSQQDLAAERMRLTRARQEAARRALRTPDGTELLEMLEERWYLRLPGKTGEAMQANAGALEVISLLRRLRERKEG